VEVNGELALLVPLETFLDGLGLDVSGQQRHRHAQVVHDLVLGGCALPVEVGCKRGKQRAVVLRVMAVGQQLEHDQGLGEAVVLLLGVAYLQNGGFGVSTGAEGGLAREGGRKLRFAG